MRLDRRMCAAATLVCPNSERLRTYLIQSAACDPLKIEIVPNATRAMNLLPSAPSRPASLPGIIKNVPRPIAGVIGNLAGNMDWLLLERVIEQTPWLSWVFVGPTSMAMDDPEARRAREAVMTHPRTDFVGRQEYGDLAGFARAFDVAVLPYKRCEPTYSGSSTRFYEHLAACRPMVATPGLEELTRKVPLLTLCDTAEQIIAALDTLREQGFDDGLTGRRWTESQHGTWSARARTVRDSLASRLGQESSVRTSSLRLARIAV
jgi:glycosyltransferase involved in cell wall biosynthesis